MNLANRVRRVERAEHLRYVELLCRAGLPQGEAERSASCWERAERECPPVPCSGGLVDVEPQLRRYAELIGDSADEVIAAYLAAAEKLGVPVKHTPGSEGWG
ncbi:MAG: hypothetical protein M1401_07960 [Chloroflexi bacterium]|nr:hypothetical protein [Chloroflexota bacterium]